MTFSELLAATDGAPVFETGLLLAGDIDPAALRTQLSRWTAAGKLIQLRRGLYAVARPYRESTPHPFVVANALHSASYVSLQSALAWYGLIPEAVPTTTSVTTRRPTTYSTDIGTFVYRHVKASLFFKYCEQDLLGRGAMAGARSRALIAEPAKALVDTIYLSRFDDPMAFVRELRLQAIDASLVREVSRIASEIASPRVVAAARALEEWAAHEGSL
jgi:hypothetical protein